MGIHKTRQEKIVISISYILIVFCTTVQITLVQWEIGLLAFCLLPTAVLTTMVMSNFWKCVWIDSTVRTLSEVPSIQTVGWRYCPYSGCSGSVPTNSRHCHTCDTCVIQRDHHCHFTGGCIGKRNLPYFVVLATTLFGLSVLFNFTNLIYIVTHETPGTLLITIVAPIQIVWYVLGFVSVVHCMVSINISISLVALIGSSVLLYHEYNLIFYNKPYLTRSMPIESSGVVNISKMERIREVFGKRWYKFYLDPTHQTKYQKSTGATRVM